MQEERDHTFGLIQSTNQHGGQNIHAGENVYLSKLQTIHHVSIKRGPLTNFNSIAQSYRGIRLMLSRKADFRTDAANFEGVPRSVSRYVHYVS